MLEENARKLFEQKKIILWKGCKELNNLICIQDFLLSLLVS